jgi:sulfonate transport system substrate-binding protein
VAQVPVGQAVPDGTVLRVGDQLNNLQSTLTLGGHDDLPFTAKWASFIGGPAMLQAFQGGAIDVGIVGSTPLIFAQAAGQRLVAVAAWATPGGGFDLVVPPGSSGIESFADLTGKRVAYPQGTAAEAGLIQALDEAHLRLADIKTESVLQTIVTTTLQAGSADAGISTEPLTTIYLSDNPGARVVARTDALTDRASYLIASQQALDDPAKVAAIAELVTRLNQSYRVIEANPDKIVDYFEKQMFQTPERSAELAKLVGVASPLILPGDLLDPQQHLADLFTAQGRIPTQVDVSAEFDARLDDVVTASERDG